MRNKGFRRSAVKAMTDRDRTDLEAAVPWRDKKSKAEFLTTDCTDEHGFSIGGDF
jgi:hypothetical protein